MNNYLAKRDAEWNEPIFNFHGLKVDCIDRANLLGNAGKRMGQISLMAQIMNLALTTSETTWLLIRALVQKEHHYTIIDEVNSILIDEAELH